MIVVLEIHHWSLDLSIFPNPEEFGKRKYEFNIWCTAIRISPF